MKVVKPSFQRRWLMCSLSQAAKSNDFLEVGGVGCFKSREVSVLLSTESVMTVSAANEAAAEEVAMADRGFELDKNFGGEAGICGEVLLSSRRCSCAVKWKHRIQPHRPLHPAAVSFWISYSEVDGRNYSNHHSSFSNQRRQVDESLWISSSLGICIPSRRQIHSRGRLR
jgi:hypothetical protein